MKRIKKFENFDINKNIKSDSKNKKGDTLKVSPVIQLPNWGTY